jgi:hypothetical protein
MVGVSVTMGLMADLVINVTYGSPTDPFVGVRLFISSLLPPLNLMPLHFAVVRQWPCPIKFSFNVAEQDEHHMHESYIRRVRIGSQQWFLRKHGKTLTEEYTRL